MQFRIIEYVNSTGRDKRHLEGLFLKKKNGPDCFNEQTRDHVLIKVLDKLERDSWSQSLDAYVNQLTSYKPLSL